jgi:pimeloyl-ACP methyl ester carboxylesterase
VDELAVPLSEAVWLLLHGTPLTPALWDEVAAQLDGEVLAPPVVPAHGVDDAQAELARRLLAALPADTPLRVAGHSFGGQVALEIALLAPERVQSLALIGSRDTPFPPFAAAAGALRAGGDVDVESALARWFRPAELEHAGPRMAYARRCLQEADRVEWADALAAIARYDRSDSMGAIEAPVTLIAAERDPVSTPAAMAALADRLPHARLHVLADAAHLTPFADPGFLAGLLA